MPKRYTRVIDGKHFQMYETGILYRSEAEDLAKSIRSRIANGSEKHFTEAKVVRLREYRYAVYVF